MEWTDELIEGLKKAWQTGDSISKMARDFKVSSNAISGKIHRLQKLYPIDFPGRPSPIKRNVVPVPKRPKPQPLPPLDSCSSSVKTIAALAPLAEPAAIIITPPVQPAIVFRPAPPVLQPHNPRASLPPARRMQPCCWPIGEPGTKAFRFCDAPTLLGKSYCQEHDDSAHGRSPRPAPAKTPPTALPG